MVKVTFSLALRALKKGDRVTRAGWNGTGMWLYRVPAARYPAQTRAARENLGDSIPYGAYYALKTVSGEVVPWVASHTDIDSEDWLILPSDPARSALKVA